MMKENKNIHTTIRSSAIALFFLLCFMFCAHIASAKRIRDTLHFKKTIAEKHELVMTDSALNEIGIDSLLNKIENIHNNLNNFINATATGYDLRDIRENFREIDSNIDIIDNNVTLYNAILDVKNLQMFEILLSSLQNQLNEWRTTLFTYNKELMTMNNSIEEYKRDTILESLVEDSAFKSLYSEEINDLNTKLIVAKKSVNAHLTELSQFQATLSTQYFETIDLHNKIADMLRKISVKSLGKEYDYLWAMHHISAAEESKTEEKIKKSYEGQTKILEYYFKRNKNDQIWMLLTGILFSLWIFLNFRKVEKTKDPVVHVHKFLIIRKSSIIPTLVVLFNLAPFFDIHPPTAYVDITEFLLVVTMTILVWRIWHRSLFFYWLFICAIYFTISITGAILTPDKGLRVFLFFLNIVAMVFGIFWYKMVRKNTLVFSGMIKIVSVIYILLNLAAAGCNLLGRLSLSKVLSVTSVHALTHIIGLSLFIQIITESFQLQTMVNQLRGGISAKLNFNKVQKLLGIALQITAVTIWSIVFTISLNLYNMIFTDTIQFLTKERKIGSTSFQLGSIILFLAIIYISNLLQKGIGSLYGKGADAWDPEIKKNGSRLAMTRLVLLVLGFLVAVAASGLPIDKITIVLGALGVGIGLGLQSIVNNLVSGVILIFEQPFRIGDYIQIGGDKGRVLDIGIRSSKLVMEEGAEVILPNADLLSGRVINWTTTNENVRVDMAISIETEHSFDHIKEIIVKSLTKNSFVVKEVPTDILLLGVKEKTMSLQLLIWVNDVHKQQTIKSDLLYQLSKDFPEHNVKLL